MGYLIKIVDLNNRSELLCFLHAHKELVVSDDWRYKSADIVSTNKEKCEECERSFKREQELREKAHKQRWDR